ncbi:unnamed protein product [Mycena citricolor]|uniref:Uncharacterized protein n=1 Tax=Mycena citricolor TaxID=2018698 RepID=A0AAD2I026_9AGAR|nr:unnamed protein product [Mycena citricolor]
MLPDPPPPRSSLRPPSAIVAPSPGSIQSSLPARKSIRRAATETGLNVTAVHGSSGSATSTRAGLNRPSGSSMFPTTSVRASLTASPPSQPSPSTRISIVSNTTLTSHSITPLSSAFAFSAPMDGQPSGISSSLSSPLAARTPPSRLRAPSITVRNSTVESSTSNSSRSQSASKSNVIRSTAPTSPTKTSSHAESTRARAVSASATSTTTAAARARAMSVGSNSRSRSQAPTTPPSVPPVSRLRRPSTAGNSTDAAGGDIRKGVGDTVVKHPPHHSPPASLPSNSTIPSHKSVPSPASPIQRIPDGSSIGHRHMSLSTLPQTTKHTTLTASSSSFSSRSRVPAINTSTSLQASVSRSEMRPIPGPISPAQSATFATARAVIQRGREHNGTSGSPMGALRPGDSFESSADAGLPAFGDLIAAPQGTGTPKTPTPHSDVPLSAFGVSDMPAQSPAESDRGRNTLKTTTPTDSDTTSPASPMGVPLSAVGGSIRTGFGFNSRALQASSSGSNKASRETANEGDRDPALVYQSGWLDTPTPSAQLSWPDRGAVPSPSLDPYYSPKRSRSHDRSRDAALGTPNTPPRPPKSPSRARTLIPNEAIEHSQSRMQESVGLLPKPKLTRSGTESSRSQSSDSATISRSSSMPLSRKPPAISDDAKLPIRSELRAPKTLVMPTDSSNLRSRQSQEDVVPLALQTKTLPVARPTGPNLSTAHPHSPSTQRINRAPDTTALSGNPRSRTVSSDGESVATRSSGEGMMMRRKKYGPSRLAVGRKVEDLPSHSGTDSDATSSARTTEHDVALAMLGPLRSSSGSEKRPRNVLKRKPSGVTSMTAASVHDNPPTLAIELPATVPIALSPEPLTPAGAVAQAYKDRATPSPDGDERDPTPYYTVFGSTSGRIVAVGSKEDWESGFGVSSRVEAVKKSNRILSRKSSESGRTSNTTERLYAKRRPSHGETEGAVPSYTPIHNEPRSRRSEPALSGGNKIWKLMKRISTGALKEQYAEPRTLPPVPPLPPLPTTGIPRTSRTLPTPPRTSTTTRSSSQDSKFFSQQSGRSSTSSYEIPNDAPPMPNSIVGQHIVPPQELYRLEVESSAAEETPSPPPDIKARPESQSLPLPPRRLPKPTTAPLANRVSDTPSIPQFSTVDAFNSFPARKSVDGTIKRRPLPAVSRLPKTRIEPVMFRAENTAAVLTEREKADRWDALLEKSDKAGGTIHMGMGALESENMSVRTSVGSTVLLNDF